MNEQVRRYGMYIAWIIALAATLGSLYFSEIRGFVPCELCWSQRIFMYPLSIILGVAVFNNDSGVVRYVLPLSLIGGSISVYHYMVQKIPGFAEVKPCLQGVPCNVQYINWLGFITIPFLALTAFLLITLIMIGVRQAFKKN